MRYVGYKEFYPRLIREYFKFSNFYLKINSCKNEISKIQIETVWWWRYRISFLGKYWLYSVSLHNFTFKMAQKSMSFVINGLTQIRNLWSFKMFENKFQTNFKPINCNLNHFEFLQYLWNRKFCVFKKKLIVISFNQFFKKFLQPFGAASFIDCSSSEMALDQGQNLSAGSEVAPASSKNWTQAPKAFISTLLSIIYKNFTDFKTCSVHKTSECHFKILQTIFYHASLQNTLKLFCFKVSIFQYFPWEILKQDSHVSYDDRRERIFQFSAKLKKNF